MTAPLKFTLPCLLWYAGLIEDLKSGSSFTMPSFLAKGVLNNPIGPTLVYGVTIHDPLGGSGEGIEDGKIDIFGQVPSSSSTAM